MDMKTEEMKAKIVSVLGEEEAEKRIGALKEQGLPERAILNKILRDIRIQTRQIKDIQGLYLGQYAKKSGSFSMYIVEDTNKELLTINIDDVGDSEVKDIKAGDIIKVSEVAEKHNIDTDTIFYVASETSHIEKVGEGNYDEYASPIGAMTKSGLYFIKGEVFFVNEVSVFDSDGTPTGKKPLVEPSTGSCNVRITIQDNQGDRAEFRILKLEKLEKLCGVKLTSATTIEELRDYLLHADIYLFTRYDEKVNENRDVKILFVENGIGEILTTP